MAEQTLKQFAEKHEYGSDLCLFLDKLEYNMELLGLGKYCVEEAMESGAAEYKVVRVALANIGRCMTDFLPDNGEKSRNDYTVDDWEKAGADEFLKHCTPAGKFRYGDFKYRTKQKLEPCGGLFD